LETGRLGGREARMLGGYEAGKLIVYQAVVPVRLELLSGGLFHQTFQPPSTQHFRFRSQLII